MCKRWSVPWSVWHYDKKPTIKFSYSIYEIVTNNTRIVISWANLKPQNSSTPPVNATTDGKTASEYAINSTLWWIYIKPGRDTQYYFDCTISNSYSVAAHICHLLIRVPPPIPSDMKYTKISWSLVWGTMNIKMHGGTMQKWL